MFSAVSCHRLRRLPLLGLLLSLLLYVGGGVLAAGHHHDERAGAVDQLCASCLLAAATVAAVGALPLLLPIVGRPSVLDTAPQRAAFSAVHRPRARAPPVLLI